MPTVKDILAKYHKSIDALDLELLTSAAIKKPREFVLAHPEYKIPVTRSSQLRAWIKRRIKHEPLAYILGQKEFFGLNFTVNQHTLIPRPETELLVEEVLKLKPKNETLIDVGTGSGNIIISLAKSLKGINKFIAIDMSEPALAVAKQNAKKHRVDKKIKFFRGNLLEPILKAGNRKLKAGSCVIIANLPYLSKNIYGSVSPGIKKYEPRSALLSGKNGLVHYERLLKQIKTLKKQCFMLNVTCFMEISPEQKTRLPKLLKSVWLDAQIDFQRDLARKWRVCKIQI